MSELMLEATEAIVKERNNVSLILQNNAGWGFFFCIYLKIHHSNIIFIEVGLLY